MGKCDCKITHKKKTDHRTRCSQAIAEYTRITDHMLYLAISG
jgi:hypothetical protein